MQTTGSGEPQNGGATMDSAAGRRADVKDDVGAGLTLVKPGRGPLCRVAADWARGPLVSGLG